LVVIFGLVTFDEPCGFSGPVITIDEKKMFSAITLHLLIGRTAPAFLSPGEDPGTLSIFTERGFDELAGRIETEFIPGSDSRKFERQFYGLSSHVDIDKQGRFVLPEQLVNKARLGSEVYLLGQKHRIDLWNRADLDRSMGIDWEGDKWPDWQGFLRMRPRIET
jgi:DNA-binding transcriptional regulator/RsmH inhibitor MraZ